MSQPAASEVARPKRAVVYLRVSTPRQMDTAIDVDAEGNSIATQREACLGKAHNLQASIVREFVEPGNSAKDIEHRPVFKTMLAFLTDRQKIDYLIVYMHSRAFRNLTDAALTKRQLEKHGIRLVSTKEDYGAGYLADAWSS